MIPADVEVLDLDPAAWAHLHDLVLQSRRERTWWYVLHSEGLILARHPELVPAAPGTAVDNPAELAASLLREGGADRVVVIDRDRLPEIALAAAPLATRGGPLTTYREAVEDLYWSSAAVVTAPEPPQNPWRRLRAAAEALRDGVTVVAVLDAAGHVTTGMRLLLDEGQVTAVDAPAPGSLLDLEADVLLAVGEDALVAALRTHDLLGALLDAATRHPQTRGADRLLVPLLSEATT